MITREPIETRQTIARPRWPRAIVAFAATIVVIAAAAVVWVVADGDGPVAAGDARIEVTFTGDGTSYVGHHQIIEGSAEVTVINDTDTPMAFLIVSYETGSDELGDELALSPEGGSFQPGEKEPAGSIDYVRRFTPGSHAFMAQFRPGTYILDVAFENDDPNYRVWRAAIIEVVSD